MLRILGIIGLISLNGHAEDFDCNYRILRRHTETYAGKIISEIPTATDSIEKDLNFLSIKEKGSNILPQYQQENLKALKQIALNLAVEDKFLQDFVTNCESIYNKFNEKDKRGRKAIYMLLYDVTAKLAEYFDADLQVFKDLNAAVKTPIISEKLPPYTSNAGHNMAPYTPIPTIN
jgi:hypothetical protein